MNTHDKHPTILTWEGEDVTTLSRGRLIEVVREMYQEVESMRRVHAANNDMMRTLAGRIRDEQAR